MSRPAAAVMRTANRCERRRRMGIAGLVQAENRAPGDLDCAARAGRVTLLPEKYEEDTE